MKRILSLDTSTKTSGYAVFKDGELFRYSSIDLSDIKDTDARFREMVSELYDLIDREHPSAVVIEEMVVPRNPQTQRMLMMILGAVYGKCIRLGIDYCPLRPTQWRKLVRRDDEKLPRKREELKEWSVKKAEELYGIEGIDDNVSDAILIGQAYLFAID